MIPIFSKHGNLAHFSLSFRSKKSKGTIGIMFPMTHAGRTVVIGSPIQSPTGTAPRSSMTGMAEISARMATSGIPNVRK